MILLHNVGWLDSYLWHLNFITVIISHQQLWWKDLASLFNRTFNSPVFGLFQSIFTCIFIFRLYLNAMRWNQPPSCWRPVTFNVCVGEFTNTFPTYNITCGGISVCCLVVVLFTDSFRFNFTQNRWIATLHHRRVNDCLFSIGSSYCFI